MKKKDYEQSKEAFAASYARDPDPLQAYAAAGITRYPARNSKQDYLNDANVHAQIKEHRRHLDAASLLTFDYKLAKLYEGIEAYCAEGEYILMTQLIVVANRMQGHQLPNMADKDNGMSAYAEKVKQKVIEYKEY